MSCVSRALIVVFVWMTDELDIVVRYGFKDDPDVSELPEYGQALLDNDGYW